MNTLITSSPTALKWLNSIKSKVEGKIPSLKYDDCKTNWAVFKSPETNRNVVYLQLQKKQIRLLTRLEISFDNSLELTPASGGWAEMYPSIFFIRSENSIDKAVEIIIASYEKDAHRGS